MKKLLRLFKVIVCPGCKKLVSDKTGKCPECSCMFGKNQPLADLAALSKPKK